MQPVRRQRFGQVGKARGWLARAGLLVACVVGCQSVLGIEDLSEDPRPAAIGGQGGDEVPGNGGDSGDGGGAAPAGGSGPGGSGGSGVGGGGGVAGSELPDSGAPDADIGGPITVAGRVIDFFQRPVPTTPVSIGAVTVLTNDNGEFSIPNITPPYDASLVESTTTPFGGFRIFGYRYEGLTRADPTLQVYSGRVERTGDVALTVNNVDFVANTDRRAIVAFASPDGRHSYSDVNSLTDTLSPVWRGNESTTGNAHALLVVREAGGDFPITYEAYQTSPLALTNGMTSSLTVDLAAQDIAQFNLTGTTSGSVLNNLVNIISARFPDGTVLPLIEDDVAISTFTYLVPVLPNASLTVAASDGSFSPLVVAHADGVPAAMAQNVQLTLPRPVTPTSPAQAAAASNESTFSWSALGQTAQVFVWHLESYQTFDGYYVITSRTQIEMPTITGYAVPDAPMYWYIETHGDYASVDAAAGPNGFLDSFALDDNQSSGPPRGNGYFTRSESRDVTYASE